MLKWNRSRWNMTVEAIQRRDFRDFLVVATPFIGWGIRVKTAACGIFTGHRAKGFFYGGTKEYECSICHKWLSRRKPGEV